MQMMRLAMVRLTGCLSGLEDFMGYEPLTSRPTAFERCYHNFRLWICTKLADSLLARFVRHFAMILPPVSMTTVI